MHSLETGIIISIAAIFFLRLLAFTFEKEISISKELYKKKIVEENCYKIDGNKKYIPEEINNIINIVIERGEKDDK